MTSDEYADRIGRKITTAEADLTDDEMFDEWFESLRDTVDDAQEEWDVTRVRVSIDEVVGDSRE